MERLADLDELVLRCHSEAAKQHLSEAVACYRAGAYRASIVTAWIALVWDMIDKFHELEETGDAQAKEIVDQLDRYQNELNRGNKAVFKQALDFEREILELARDRFQLLDHQQFTDLDRLREDRNRCAHPSFQRAEEQYHPSAELARSHLRNLIDHLLGQPPVQGKAALERLRTRIVSKYFPSDIEKAKLSLQEAGFQRPKPSLVRGLIDELMHGFFDENDAYYNKRVTLTALKACLELQRAEAEVRIRSQCTKLAATIPASLSKGLIALFGSIPECWELCPPGKKDELSQYVTSGPNEDVARIISFALTLPELKPSAQSRSDGGR